MAGKVVTIRDLRRLSLPEPGGATAGGILGTHRGLDRQQMGTLGEGKPFIEKQVQFQESKPVAKSDDEAYESYLDEESYEPGGLLTPAGATAGGIFGEGKIITEKSDLVWELRDRQKLLLAQGKVLVQPDGDDEYEDY